MQLLHQLQLLRQLQLQQQFLLVNKSSYIAGHPEEYQGLYK